MKPIIGKDLKLRTGTLETDNMDDYSIMYDPPNDPPYPYEYSSGQYLGSFIVKRFRGWDIPDFHKRLRSGELLPYTPFKSFISEGSSSGSYDCVFNSGAGNARWWTTGNYSPRSSWRLHETDLAEYAPDASALRAYIQEAAAKIYSSGHDTLTFLAELVEVRHLFVNTAKKLIKLRIPKNWKSLSNEWLSARYGWRTLFYDITSLNQAISNLNKGVERARFSERSQSKYSTVEVSEETQEYTHYWLDHVWTTNIEVSMRGSVTADAWIPQFQFNPLVTGWEIIPLSFVLDWFISVGKAISALSFLVLQSNYTASYGYKITAERSYSAEIGSTKPTFVSGFRSQTASSVATLEVRTPSTVPLTPHIKLRLKPAKIVDLIGLVIQRL